MGIILDSSVLVAGERRIQTVQQILSLIKLNHQKTEVAISVVTVVELTHGIYRARTGADRNRRREFVDDVCHDISIQPVSVEIAGLAGRIEGEQMAAGVSIAFQDLLIGATALHLDFAVATLNVRHFQRIPNLEIVSPFS